MIQKFTLTILTVSVAFLLALPASAAKITVDGDVVFDSGGFESETVGADPANPTVGSYSLAQTSGANIEVFDAVTPGANEGANYLALRNPTGGNNTVMGAHLGFDSIATTDDVISAEFALQLDSTTSTLTTNWDMHAFFGFTTAVTSPGSSFFGNAQTWVGFVPRGSSYYSDADALGLTLDFTGMGSNDLFLACHNGTAWQQVFDTTGAPMFASFDQWYDIGIDYTVGSGSFTLSVDDATSASLATLGSDSGVSINGLQCLANVSTAAAGYHIDSVVVPEPGTIVLLLSGLVGLMLWRRR